MTNFDKIKGMSDRELAKFLDKFSSEPCSYCVYEIVLPDSKIDCSCTSVGDDCEEGHLAWLRKSCD